MRDYLITIMQAGGTSLHHYSTAANMVEAFKETMDRFPEVAREHEVKGGSVMIDILTLGDEHERHIEGGK